MHANRVEGRKTVLVRGRRDGGKLEAGQFFGGGVNVRLENFGAVGRGQ